MNPNGDSGNSTAGNGEPICSCGATTYNRKTKNQCANGHFLRGNRAAEIVGEHGAQFWREQNAARDEIIRRLLRDAGFPNLDAAPYILQIGMETIAESTVIKRMAYKRLVESGGPLSESGRPRRALVVWDKRADMQMRDMRNHMDDYIAAIRANGPAGGNSEAAKYGAMSNAEMIAELEALAEELRALDAQKRAIASPFAVPSDGAARALPSCTTRTNSEPALSRDPAASSTDSEATSTVTAARRLPETPDPLPTPSAETPSPTAESSSPEPAPSSPAPAPPSDPHEALRNLRHTLRGGY